MRRNHSADRTTQLALNKIKPKLRVDQRDVGCAEFLQGLENRAGARLPAFSLVFLRSAQLWKHGRLHFTARFRFSRRTINFNPDQVSSIAHTFTSTNPSGNATARTTSSVTSVSTPDDLFGQETQTVAASAIFSRRTGNRFANSLCFLMKTWTKVDADLKRFEKVTPSGIVPSNRR